MIVRDRQLPRTALQPKVQRLPPHPEPPRRVDAVEFTWLLLCEFWWTGIWPCVPMYAVFFLIWLLGRIFAD